MLIAIAAGVGIAVSNSNKHNNANASTNGSSGQSNSGGNSTKGGTNSDPNDPSIFDKNPDFHKVFFGMAYTPNGGVMPDCGAKQGESESLPCTGSDTLGCLFLDGETRIATSRLRAVPVRLPAAAVLVSSAACALHSRARTLRTEGGAGP